MVQRRNKLTPIEHSRLSKIICSRILSSDLFQQSKTIATYKSINNEVDLSELFRKPKNHVLPVIQDNHSMTFRSYNATDPLTKNQYGIWEPKGSKPIKPHRIELCLIPLVGFKRDGSRLGMGGGYYDRYFESNQKQEKPTVLAGVAYDFQEDDSIQAESWDIPLDIIFTNKETIIT